MYEAVLVKHWLSTIGKEHIQEFQDNFATSHNISLCLRGFDGEALTVWSNGSLLCHHLTNGDLDRCRRYCGATAQRVRKKGKPVVADCYVGMKYFMSPVISGIAPIAVFHGGMIDASSDDNDLFRRFSVPRMAESDLAQIYRLLNSTMVLLAKIVLPPQTTENVLYKTLKTRYGLSEREITVIEGVMQGFSNKKIAEQLFISEKTVKTHIGNILRKTQTKDRVEVRMLALEISNRI